MHQRLLILAACLIGLVSLAACTVGPPTLTPVPPPTVTPTAVPTAVPTATPDPNRAPSVAEIKAAVARIYAQSGNDAYAAVQQYSAGLKGKAIQGWDGWVEQTYQTNGAWAATLALEDPYTPAVPPTVNPTSVPGPPMNATAEAELVGLAADAAAALRAGQHVRFSGALDGLGGGLGFSLQVSNVHLDQADPAPVEVAPTLVVPATPPAAEPDLQGVVMSLERTACYGTCPTYTVRVTGDGMVVWEGTMNVQATGTRTTRISTAAVRQLVAAFQRTNYFALADRYDAYMVTDLPSAITSFTQGGQTKTINHYYGDLSAPIRLSILEDQIDYVLNTRQWIGPR